MEKKFQITNDEGLVVCSEMNLQVASNIYAFLNDIYNKDTLILKPILPKKKKKDSKVIAPKIEKVEAEGIKD